jgi:hypothetical protein
MALPIPNLPTDNLYKFVAISGVTLFMVATYLLINQTSVVFGHAIDAHEASNVAKVRMESILKRIQNFDHLLDNIIADQNGTLKTDKNKFVIRYSDDEIKTTRQSLNQAYEELALENVKVKNALTRSTFELLAMLLIACIWSWVCSVGIRMARWGFTNWQERIQTPIDARLQKLALIEEGVPSERDRVAVEDEEGT